MDLVIAAFVIIPLALAGALTYGAWHTSRRHGGSTTDAARAALLAGAGSAAWLALTWSIAASGVLARWDQRPPPFVVLMALVLGVALALAFSPFGRRLATLPLWVLVGVQGFRLPLEFAMHAMATRGVMPAQMSYAGRNVDILTGITALVVAALLRKGYAGRRTAMIWNVCGLLALANIIGVALLSTPMFAWFGQDRLNTWVTDPPFVWLPTVMVLAALSGHLVIARALRR